MRIAFDQFQTNIGYARGLVGLVRSLTTVTTGVIDLSDILRAALVLAVSALDYFVHEFVRFKMLQAHRGVNPPTDAHLNFKIPLSFVRIGLSDLSKDDWMDQAIREAHSWLSFQHPDKIADAIRLVSSVRLWEVIGGELGLPSRDVKVQLQTIVDRRNKIAHEADMDPLNPGQRWMISDADVESAISFLESLVNAMSRVAP